MLMLSFGFISFVVGGKTFTIKMKGKITRGITFSLPRNSLMTTIKYRIFDDLLIGNFMIVAHFTTGMQTLLITCLNSLIMAM